MNIFRSGFSRAIVLIVASVFIANPAFACSQDKIKGTWYGTAFFVSDIDGLGYVMYCKLKLNSKGNFNSSKSVCGYDTGEIVYPVGRIKVGSNCLMSASFLDLYDRFNNYLGTSILDIGAVDKGHTTMNAVGDFGTTTPFTFTAVKK
jgi:hypothetical protein